MNDIYTIVSNSILEYIKSQGQSAKKPCLILRIHYYNISGILHSIDILKKLETGDKITSTTRQPKSRSNNSNTTLSPNKSTKKKIEKETDLTTRHTKLGLMTPTNWEKLKSGFYKLLAEKVQIMDKYCAAYKNITATTPFFATGENGINIAAINKKIPLEIGNGFVLNAGCDFISKHNISSNKNKGLQFTHPFSSIYQIFPHSKSVLRISDCKSLDEFYNEFGKSPHSGIKWESVMSKYDGILVENLDCADTTKKPNYKKLLLDILGKKEDENQIKNIKMHLAMKKLTSLGYIWRIGKNKFVKVV